MTAILSNSTNRLIDFLVERIEFDPFKEVWILLSGSINKQWLSVELIKRIPQQAFCGVRFLSWKEALSKLACPVPNFFEAGCAFATTDWFGNRKNELIWRLSHQVQDAILYGIEEQTEWQKKLSCSLERWRSLPQNFKRKPAQIHCFCIEELSDKGWEVFLREKALFYFFSPCRMFWEDLCTDWQRDFLISQSSAKVAMEQALSNTHPLLANWGRITRNVLKKIEMLEVVDCYEEIGGDSLLHQIQRDLLDLRTLEDEITPLSPDSSLQIIAAGASKLREVAILKEEITKLVCEQGFFYSEILVLAPEISAYEPLIQFVFGEEIPKRIGLLPSLSLLCRAVLLFLNLIENDWDADDVMELFEQAPFQKKQNLSRDDLSWFRLWMKEAYARGGWQNFSESIEKMRRGLIFLLPEEEGPTRISTIDWGEAERLEKLISLLFLLRKQTEMIETSLPQKDRDCGEELAQKRCSLREWAELLKTVANELFEAEEEEWSSLIQMIFAASFFYPDEKFAFSFIHSALKEQASKEMKGALLVDAVDCLSLQPGAIRPARAIFLLGADSEQFSRSEEISSVDWKIKKPDQADLQKSLLLQMIFAAKEKLSVIYCHVSNEDGHPLDIAHPIQELLLLLEKFYGLREIKKSSSPPPAKAIKKEAWPKIPIQTIPTRWQISDLLLLMRDPWSYFLRRTLGIYLKREPLFAELSFKECELSYTQERRLLKNFDPNQLPEGAFGVLAEEKLRLKIASWKKHFASWGETIRFHDPIVLDSGVEIVGEIEYARPGELFVPWDLNFTSYLRCWPAFLAAATLSSTPATIYSLKSGKSKTFEHLDAKKELSLLIKYALRAQESFSPLISAWAEPFLKGERCKDSEEEVFQWVMDRFSVPPFEQQKEEWQTFLQEVFRALL